MTTTATLTATDTDLEGLVAFLRQQRARAVDVIGPATAMHAELGQIILDGLPVLVDDEGVTDPNGRYDLGVVGLEHTAEKLVVPLPFLRRMHATRPDVFDANVNLLVHGGVAADPDPRRWMYRLIQGDAPGTGFVRAILSDAYKRVDNLDFLLGVLDGIRESGHPVDVQRCDVTERRMYVQVRSSAVSVLAPDLLADYKSPFTGQSGADCPQVFAGFVITDSETGDGGYKLLPRITVEVCRNGATFSRDAFSGVHLGSRQKQDGIVRYSDATLAKEIDLIRSKTADAVATFMDTEYVTAKLAEWRTGYQVPVEHPETEVQRVAKAAKFSDEEADLILAAFIRGGQMTAGGIMQAVTAAAQDDSISPDRRYEIEDMTLDVLAIAAAR